MTSKTINSKTYEFYGDEMSNLTTVLLTS